MSEFGATQTNGRENFNVFFPVLEASRFVAWIAAYILTVLWHGLLHISSSISFAGRKDVIVLKMYYFRIMVYNSCSVAN